MPRRMRSALRWIIRDKRSARPAAAARANNCSGDGAIVQRASASAPTIRPVARLDLRLVQHLDLLVGHDRFKQRVAARE